MGDSIFNVTCGADPAGVAACERHYAKVNPWMHPGVLQADGKVLVGEDIVPWPRLVAAEFYNDFGKKSDVVRTAGPVLEREGERLV